MPSPQFSNAADINPSILAEIRVAAMRPSLEAVGRFDPIRARDRFLSTYVAKDTWLVHVDGTLAGFYVLRDMGDHLYLDHLYVDPAFQGSGLGRVIINRIQADTSRIIRLMALKQSRANGFYSSCGFRAVAEDTFDIHYEWTPAS